MKVEHAQLSDIGLRRKNNQDAVVVVTATAELQWRRRGHLFMVADGMGAHAAGELASKMAVDAVSLNYSKLLDLSPANAVRRAIEDANTEIHRRGQAALDFHGMGTTSSVLLLLPEGALIAHVGDSRVYRLRNEQLDQLSFDHSLVWEMMASGQVPEDQVPAFIPKNIITRSLGPNPQVQIDIEGPFKVEPGDIYFLCSDGLTGQVQNDELGAILHCLPPDEATRALVDLANLRGGPDNITVIVAKIPGVAEASGGQAVIRKGPSRAIEMLAWGVAAALMAFAMLLVHFVGYISAGLAALGGLSAAGVAFFGRKRGIARNRAMAAPRGGAPYVTTDCRVTREFVDQLSKVVQQLRDAATEERWSVDWERFEAMSQRAVEATTSGDFEESVRQHCRTIISVMSQLRRDDGK